MLEEIIIEKSILVKNKLYTINKYLSWFVICKDIMRDYFDLELDRNKLYEFINFISIAKIQDESFKYNDKYKILEIHDDNYIIKFILDSEFKIEYTIKESNTNYLFDVDEQNNYSNTSNILYTHVKYNINDVLNKIVYNICKKYMLG